MSSSSPSPSLRPSAASEPAADGPPIAPSAGGGRRAASSADGVAPAQDSGLGANLDIGARDPSARDPGVRDSGVRDAGAQDLGAQDLGAQLGADVATVLRIEGRVQGVGYRHWARLQAEQLGLRGFVRNLTDGSVEALLIGEPHRVGRMLTLCEEGPEPAAVARISTRRAEPELASAFTTFRRLRTAAPGAPAG